MNKQNNHPKTLMHRAWAWLLCLSMLASLTNFAVVATETEELDNLLVNGDFENGLTGWNSIASDMIAVEESNAFLRLADSTSSDYKVTQQLQNLLAGQKLTITGRRRLASKLASNCEITIYPTQNSLTVAGTQMTVQLNTPTEGWEEFQIEYVIPESYNGVQIQLRAKNNDADVADWDDIKVSVDAASVSDNILKDILKNGDFENGNTSWNTIDSSCTIKTEEGNAYLQMADNTWVYKRAIQYLVNLQAGQRLIISGLRRQAAVINSCQLVISPTKNNVTVDGFATIINLNTVTNGWENFFVEYTIPEGFDGLWLQLRVRGGNLNQVVDWDEIKVLDNPETYDGWIDICANGNFESGKTSWANGNSGTIMTEDGNSFLRLTDTGWSWKNVIQMLTGLEEGQRFVIRGQRRQSTAISAGAHVQLVLTPARGSVTGDSLKVSMNSATDGWEDFTIEYTIPEGYTALWVQMRVQGGVPNGADWDNIQVLTEPTVATSIAQGFRAMLAEESETSQHVTRKFAEGVTEPFPGQSNIVLNGTFDISDSWSLGTTGTIADGALIISGPDAAYARQSVPIVGGAEYYVTYKYKVAADQTLANPTLKVGFFASTTLDGANCLSEKYLGMQTSSDGCIRDGEWHTRSRWIYPPANAEVLVIEPMMLQSADQTVMYDDITITMTQAPFALKLMTDQVFYYTGTMVGTFTTSVNTNYYPDLANAQVKFQVFDGVTELWNTTVTSSEGIASTEFAFAGRITQKEHPYCVKATVYNADGTEADASTQNIFIYDRPEYVDENGLFKKGDEEYYPIMSYQVWYTEKDAEKNHYDEIAESGITLVQIYGTTAKDQLDILQQYGMMGVIALHANMKPAGAEVNIDYTTGVLSNPEVTEHPALFGYIVMDEVYLALTSPEMDMENSYRLIRMMDKKHPIITMEAMTGYYDEAGKYVDILFIDPYGTAESQYAYNATITALEAVNHAKSVYATLCTYGTESSWHRAEDIRNNCYQALIAGASGLGYYSISDPATLSDGTHEALWDSPFDSDPDYTVWDMVNEFGTKERDLAYDHFVYEKTPTFNEVLGEDYWYSSWVEDDGSIYMIVLGMQGEQNLAVQIPLASTDGTISVGDFVAEIVAGVSQSYTGAKTFSGNGTLNVTVEDTSAILYKITPTPENPGN